MPQRKAIRQVFTPEVQGEDSWVKVSRLKVGQWFALQGPEGANGAEPSQAEQVRRGLKVLVEHVLGWNWVDDEGQPLPQPKDDPAVLEQLTDEEALCLLRVLQGPSEAQLKN